MPDQPSESGLAEPDALPETDRRFVFIHGFAVAGVVIAALLGLTPLFFPDVLAVPLLESETAVCLLVAASALAFARDGRLRLLQASLGLSVAIFGGIAFLGRVAGIHLEQLPGGLGSFALQASERVGVNTSVSLLFGGIALASGALRGKARKALPFLALLAVLPALLALSGGMFGAPIFPAWADVTHTQPLTIIAFLLLALGLLAAQPQGGPLELIFSHGPAGIALRSLLPAGFLILLLLEYAAVQGYNVGLYNSSSQAALVLTAGWILLGALIFRAARALADSDRDRTEAEDRLLESEAGYRALVEASPQVVWFGNAEGAITYFNNHWFELTGMSVERSLGDGWAAAIDSSYRDQVLAAWKRMAPLGKPYEAEVPFRTKSGEMRWHLSRGVPLMDTEGRVARWIGVSMDIHDRRDAEDAQRASEQRFRLAAQAVSGVIYDWEPRTDLVQWSGGLERLVGVATFKAPPNAKWWRDRIHPEDRERVQAAIQNASQRGDEIAEREYRVKHVDGHWVHVWDRALLIYGEKGELIRVVGSNSDITERRVAEEGLREADRKKNEFLAMLAHELRNPLASVRNAVTLLREGEEDSRDWAVGVVDRQVTHLARLVDDLLDAARITRGAIELRPVKLDAAEALDRAVESARPLLDEYHHTLTPDYAKGAMWLDADPARLDQIILNLLSNAARYTPSNGKITLAARKQGEQVIISVSDTGVGIPAERLDSLWDLFVQGDRSLDRTEGGLGIGLTVVRKLVELHGGRVGVSSPGVGKGATFTISLPAAPAPERQLPAPPAAPPNKAAGGKVLVVDDNVDTATGLSRLLKRAGYEVQTAYAGPAALELAKVFAPRFVLLDLGLPGMDGYQVAAQLRAHPPSDDLVLIAISGYGQEEDLKRSQAAGFDLHLVKPVEFQVLKSHLLLRGNGAAAAG